MYVEAKLQHFAEATSTYNHFEPPAVLNRKRKNQESKREKNQAKVLKVIQIRIGTGSESILLCGWGI